MAPKTPKPQRTEAFESGRAPLRMEDMTPKEQKTAISIVSDVSKSTRANLRETTKLATKPNAKAADIQKGNKAKEALKDAVNKPYSHDEAVDTRVKYITKAANEHRLPGEHIGGAGFYFQHHAEVADVVKGTDVPMRSALDASSKLSVRTKPELEKESLNALVQGHHKGSVHFGPELVNALRSIKDPNGNSTPVHVAPEHMNQTVPFAKVEPKVAAELTNPQVREVAQRHSSGVNLDSLAKTAIRGNIGNAQKVMQGTPSNPYLNPKQVSYASAHEISVPNTPEHEEYQVRTQHIGKTLRGELPRGQQMFDYTGLQKSNEGALSNRALTPADLHERRVSYNQPGKAFTAAPESNVVRSKSRTLPSGKTEGIGMGDPRIKPIAIEHAVHQDAVHRTADKLQKDLGLPHTVPATLVQETNWAGQRRDEGDDSQYNEQRRAQHKTNMGAQFDKTSLPPRLF